MKPPPVGGRELPGRSLWDPEEERIISRASALKETCSFGPPWEGELGRFGREVPVAPVPLLPAVPVLPGLPVVPELPLGFLGFEGMEGDPGTLIILFFFLC